MNKQQIQNLLNNITVEELYRARARKKHLDFIKYIWPTVMPNSKFKVGKHILKICDLIDESFENFRKGISTFNIITLPPRHGKSEVTSKYQVPHWLGEFPDSKIMVISHSVKLLKDFSRWSRGVIKENSRYNLLYPHVKLNPSHQDIMQWGLYKHNGVVNYITIGGHTAGIGGNKIILDDYLGSREDAESETIREKLWSAFQADIITRLESPCSFDIIATRWNIDDIIGRIEGAMKNSPKFPQFKIIKFPYKEVDDKGKVSYLFPERYDKEYYEMRVAALGGENSYQVASLYNCDPTVLGGNFLKTDKLKYYEDSEEIPKNLRWVRVWDLASSEKQINKSDPDWTVGTKIAVERIPTNISGIYLEKIYVDDVIRFREEAIKRNKIIMQTWLSDGPDVMVGVEVFAAYKDTYTTLRATLPSANLQKLQFKGDKVQKAIGMQPIFETGNVYLRKAEWNEEWIKEIGSFPSAAHDDQVDSLSIGYKMCKGSTIPIATLTDIKQGVMENKKIIELVRINILHSQRINVKLEEYVGYVREFILKMREEVKQENIKNHCTNEIDRLDKNFNYEKYKYL